MSFAKLFTIWAVAGLALGCTKGVPDFGVLDSNSIPQPLFSGATEESLTAGSPAETFAIQGDCDPKIRDITGTALGTATTFSTLASMSVTPVTVNCSTTGHFSFTLKSLTNLGYTPTNNTVYDIQLRAVTSGGISNPSVIHITYSTTGGPDPKHIMITSGATESSGVPRMAVGTTFKAQIRVGHMINNGDPTVQDAMTIKTGTQFKMKSGVAAQND